MKVWLNKFKDFFRSFSQLFRHILKNHHIEVGIIIILLTVLTAIYHHAPADTSALPDNDTYVTNGTVNTIVVSPSTNTTYIGGNFTYIGPNTGQGVSINTSTGLVQTPLLKINGAVNASISDGLGGWYIGGNFTGVGGVARNDIAHINPDGTLDSSWNPNANGDPSSFVLSGTTLYVGGNFTNIGGQPRNYIAALDTTTGLATTWNPNADNSVNSLALSDTTLYVAGGFRNIDGNVRNFIAALDTTTTVPGSIVTAWDPNVSGDVYTIALSGTTLYAGGPFTIIDGQPRNRIAALDTTTTVPGSIVTAWNPNIDGGVMALVFSGTTLYAGGSFYTVDGQPRNRIAALDTTTIVPGSMVMSWDPNVSTGSSVQSLLFSGTTLYAGGPFTVVDGQPRNHIAALDTTTVVPGSIVTAWNPNANGTVSTFSIFGTTLYVGGDFTSVGGQLRNYLAALNSTNGVVTGWNSNISNQVYSLALSNDGATLYAGGDFTSVGALSRNYIAAIDTTSGLATDWDPNADSAVRTLLLSGTTIYAGGDFFTVDGKTRNCIVALDTTTVVHGSIATDWNPNIDNTVRTLALSGTTLYAGGNFTLIGVQSRNNIAAIDTISGSATDWNPNPDGRISSLALSGTTLYAGGAFSNIDGQPRNRIAALDTTTIVPGSMVTAWNPNANGTVNTLSIFGTTLYAGGYFTTIGGQTRTYLGAVSTTTGLATTWNPSPDSNDGVQSLTVSGSKLYVGGSFSSMAYQSQSYLARFSITSEISAPNTPASAIGTDINGTIETAGFDLSVGLGTSGATAGDTLELLLNGSSFSTPLVHTLLDGDISAGTYSFNIVHGQLGSDGTKNITAKVNSGPASSALVLNLNTVIPPSTPTANPSAGTYSGTQNVSLSSVGSTSIRYTTDGTIPSCAVGTIYSSAISVYSTQTINAKGCDNAGNPSALGSFLYTISGISGGGGYFPTPISKTIPKPVTVPVKNKKTGLAPGPTFIVSSVLNALSLIVINPKEIIGLAPGPTMIVQSVLDAVSAAPVTQAKKIGSAPGPTTIMKSTLDASLITPVIKN